MRVGHSRSFLTARQGSVCDPEPAEVAKALAWLSSHTEAARAWGKSGKTLAERLNWDVVVDRLLGA